jgi:flagellar motor switch protein FliM
LQPFDFRAPHNLSREQLRALQMVHDTASRRMTTVFATSFRVPVQVSVAGIEQMPWDSFSSSAPDPTYLAVVALEPLSGNGVLHVPLSLVMTMVDLLLGGDGRGDMPNRPLTDIEAVLVRDLVDRLLNELVEAIEPLYALTAGVTAQESNLQFTQIAAPADPTVVVTYRVQLGQRSDVVAFCVPVRTLQPVLDAAANLAQVDGRRRGGKNDVSRDAITDGLLDVLVDVSLCFRQVTCTPTEILSLEVGDILPLHHASNVPLTVLAADRPVFTAKPGRRGRRLAFHVVDETARSDA